MSLLDFTQEDLPDIPEWLTNKTDASLMLWAGDCINAGVTDVARLPAYDAYLCLGLQDLSANLLTAAANPFCICVIDVNEIEQIKKLIRVFSNKFKTIDSDYNGPTPTLHLIDYEHIMQDDAKVYNIIGINNGPTDDIALINSIELFVPALPGPLKPRRLWTKEMLQLAADNNMPVEVAWVSPDLYGIEYNDIRATQNRYTAERSSRFPHQFVHTYNDENISLEEHWNKLIPYIFETDYTRAFSLDNIDQSWLELVKPRLATYLYNKIGANLSPAENTVFQEFYAAESDTVDNQVKAVQHAMKVIRESKLQYSGLIPSLEYYKDPRLQNADQMVFGMVYTKPIRPPPPPYVSPIPIPTTEPSTDAANESAE